MSVKQTIKDIKSIDLSRENLTVRDVVDDLLDSQLAGHFKIKDLLIEDHHDGTKSIWLNVHTQEELPTEKLKITFSVIRD